MIKYPSCTFVVHNFGVFKIVLFLTVVFLHFVLHLLSHHASALYLKHIGSLCAALVLYTIECMRRVTFYSFLFFFKESFSN
jgi:hypothetical protein